MTPWMKKVSWRAPGQAHMIKAVKGGRNQRKAFRAVGETTGLVPDSPPACEGGR